MNQEDQNAFKKNQFQRQNSTSAREIKVPKIKIPTAKEVLFDGISEGNRRKRQKK